MLNAKHNTKINQIFHKALYWKAAAFGTLCIQQEYQVYERLAKERFWDMSSHLKKTVKRFWRTVTMGYAMNDKYLLIVEESFFEPRDAWEELALQIVQDIQDLYDAMWKKDAKATLEIGTRQFDLLEKYCALVGEQFDTEHPLVKCAMEQQLSWAEELVAVTKQDKKNFLAELSKRDVPIFIDSDITEIRAQMPKEKKAKKQVPELRYISRHVEEKNEEYMLRIKKEVEDPNYVEDMINETLQEYKKSTDFIEKYDTLMNVYISCGKHYLKANNDTVKFKGYYYLAAKAGEICFQLAERGHKTYQSVLNENLRTKNNVFYYAHRAILADVWDLAIHFVSEDSLLGAILMEDYERAKKYIPEEFTDISKSDELEQLLWTIVYLDEKKMNSLIEKYIKQLRRDTKSSPGAYFDSADLALIKLAMVRGMNCDLNIAELPIHLLDDVKINEDEWRLPEDKGLEELLK